MQRMLPDYNEVLQREGFVVLPWITSPSTKRTLYSALMLVKNGQCKTKTNTMSKMLLDLFIAGSEYNVKTLEEMTRMEWSVVLTDDNINNEEVLGVYYNCAETEHVCTVTRLYERSNANNGRYPVSVSVAIPSGFAIILYHSLCRVLSQPTTDTRPFFGLKYKNAWTNLADVTVFNALNDISTKDDDMIVGEILTWVLEEGEIERQKLMKLVDSLERDQLSQMLCLVEIEQML